jgi:hypothetical protein
MGKVFLVSHFKPEDVNAGMLAELREIAAYLFDREGFEEAFATRKGFTKMNLTTLVRKIDKPDQLVLGAPAVENITFVKKSGDYPGSLVIYKDRLMFHTTNSYRLGGVTSTDKEMELSRLKSDIVSKANTKNLFFEGNLDKFSLTRLTSFNKLEVIGFMQDAKSTMYGLNLKAF